MRTALQRHHCLSFRYVSHSGRCTDRIVEPARLVFKQSAWYLHAFCRTAKAHRLFRITRMSALTMLTETFAPSPAPIPILDITDRPEAQTVPITLRIHRSVLDRVLDLCPFESLRPDGPEHYLAVYPFINNDYYADQLLALGPACECLAPPEVRSRLADRLARIAALYRSPPPE